MYTRFTSGEIKDRMTVVLFYLLKVRPTVHEHHMKVYKGSGGKDICRDEGSSTNGSLCPMG
jgi:hypothetical protein